MAHGPLGIPAGVRRRSHAHSMPRCPGQHGTACRYSKRDTSAIYRNPRGHTSAGTPRTPACFSALSDCYPCRILYATLRLASALSGVGGGVVLGGLVWFLELGKCQVEWRRFRRRRQDQTKNGSRTFARYMEGPESLGVFCAGPARGREASMFRHGQ